MWLTAMFRASLSAFFLAANFFSLILFSMTASSSLVKGRKTGRLLSDTSSAWFSDMVGTSSGSGSRYHLKKKSKKIRQTIMFSSLSTYFNLLTYLVLTKCVALWAYLRFEYIWNNEKYIFMYNLKQRIHLPC